MSRRPPARSAWLMLGGAFTAFTVSAALMHSYPVYLVAFIEEFGWSRAETSLAYSVSQLVGGVSSPFVGVLVDRLGPRRLLLLGSVLLVLSLAASAFASELWQMVVLYGVVMTVGANCLGLVVFVPILSRHFVRRRGMAISIVQSANGIARGISAPLVQLAISADRLAHDLSGAGRADGARSRCRWPAMFRRAEPVRRSARRNRVPGRAGPARRRRRRRRRAGPCARRRARRISGCCSRSICSPARQLLRVAAPARLRRRYRLRQALCRRGARHRRVSRGARHRRDRHPVRLSRPRGLGDPGLWVFDRRRGVARC